MIASKSAIVAKIQHGERLDLAATALFTDLSRKKIKQIIDDGGAYVNKKRILIAKHAVKAGDKIELFWEEKKPSTDKVTEQNKSSSKLSAENILFENKDFFVIDKPAGIASQATLTSQKETLLHELALCFPEKIKPDSLFLVHRLDKDTSGVMIVARNKKAQGEFEELFRTKNIQKTYSALCFYTPKQTQGKIDYPIAKHPFLKNTYQASQTRGKAHNAAKEALTRYEVVEVFAQGDASFLRCYPETGRTHQIRVHLSAIGCPILGDKTYSNNIVGHRFNQMALRQMLHAEKVTFTLRGQEYTFASPLPQDIQDVLKRLKSA